jgi:DnaJ-class molecular chaperone
MSAERGFNPEHEHRSKRTYYEILGIGINASEDEIRSAYREKAKAAHPDIPGNAGKEEEMKLINEAYDVLSDKQKRNRYDYFSDVHGNSDAANTSNAGPKEEPKPESEPENKEHFWSGVADSKEESPEADSEEIDEDEAWDKKAGDRVRESANEAYDDAKKAARFVKNSINKAAHGAVKAGKKVWKEITPPDKKGEERLEELRQIKAQRDQVKEARLEALRKKRDSKK